MSLRRPVRLLLVFAVASLVSACGPTEPVVEAAAPVQDENPGPVRVGPATEGAERAGLGKVVEDFGFTDIDGIEHRLSTYAGGKPLVLVTRDTTCPLCLKFGRLIAAFEKEVAADGVKVLFFDPMTHDDPAAMKEERRALGFRGAYVDDRSLAIARRLTVRSTTEVFLLDGDRRLVYRGAFDDRHGFGYSREEARFEYLRDALAAVKAGRPVKVDATTAPGCDLDLSAGSRDARGVTYHGRIAGIVQERCLRCHREGSNAPFGLETYQQVKSRRGTIRTAVRRNVMPPWFASDDVGGPWINDLRLEPREREDLLAWLKAGCPEGDPKDAPPPKTWPSGWTIGEPDLIVKTKPLAIPTKNFEDYLHVVVETNVPADRWIRRMELRNDIPEALHHILIFEWKEEYEDPDWFINKAGELALQEFFMIWAPGADPIVYPDDRAKLMKKNLKLIFQIHYTNIGRSGMDVPKLGIVFADEPPKYPIRCDAASTTAIRIPPGAKDVHCPGFHKLDEPARILGFVPHMHLRGSGFSMDIILPDGTEKPVLRIPRFDFNWQQAYRLVEPIDVPAGTTIRATGVYDNSPDNPALTPEQYKSPVKFGPYTNDEMMIGYFEWVPLEKK